MTEKGFYNSHERRFTPREGEEVDQDYIDRHVADVRNRLTYSRNVFLYDYFGALFGPDDVK